MTDFDIWWKEMKPAECDEVREYFVECWQRARAVQREKDAEICLAAKNISNGEYFAAAIRSQK